jgi:hypothetical protein
MCLWGVAEAGIASGFFLCVVVLVVHVVGGGGGGGLELQIEGRCFKCMVYIFRSPSLDLHA